MIRRTVLPAALLMLLVAGCGNSSDGAGSTSSGSVPSAAPSASVSAPASALPEATKPAKPVTSSTTTITGTVASGVEPNCTLLQETGGGTRLLVFKDESLRASAAPGSKVSVTGTPQPGMMSTCQQGEPFLVSSVTPG
ncbi:hypothetical protein [Actinoplanes sp. NPDC020271]|uniref:hypothetical protein n=1 Tax=Actinoplanes sp. NPDC020271 TaxID=3363896 RepID=UPI0037B706C1